MPERRGAESQTPAIIQGNGYADASPIETSGPNLSINTIVQKRADVKEPFQMKCPQKKKPQSSGGLWIAQPKILTGGFIVPLPIVQFL